MRPTDAGMADGSLSAAAGLRKKSELTRDAEKMKVFRGVGFVGGLGCWMTFFLSHELGEFLAGYY